MTDSVDRAASRDRDEAAPEQPPRPIPRPRLEAEPINPSSSTSASAPTPTPSTSAGTRGFLFSDLRGYAAFVERSGDQAAAELLDRYRTLVREVIAAHDGAEIRTEGDSFYVVFPNASAAVEAGLEIVTGAGEQSTSERPIRVGVGIHAGETVATTEGLVGGAVNIAARVCAKAQSGEVLVTDTVRALTRTFLPYRYTSLGTQQLKGIAGGIPLYRVEVSPSTTRARLRRQLSARRGRVALVVGAIVVLLAVGAGVYAANRGPDCLTLPATTKDVVAKIDPSRNCVVATYEVGKRPGALIAASSGIWVANQDDWTLSRIDPSTGHAIQTGASGSPVDLAAASNGDVYVLVFDNKTVTTFGVSYPYDHVAKVSARNTELAQIAALPESVAGGLTNSYRNIVFVGGRAWVSDAAFGSLVRLHLEGSGGLAVGGYTKVNIESPAQVVAPTTGGFSLAAAGTGPIVGGQGVIWVANTEFPRLYSLSGTSSRADSISLDEHGGSEAIDASGSDVWLGRTDNYLTRYDPGQSSMTSFDTGSPVTSIVAGADAVWVAHLRTGSVSRVDPKTGDVVATLKLGGQPADVAIDQDGSVWVTLQGP